MNNTFTCPQCGKFLKTMQALAAGTKIKCPQCATVFAAPDDESFAPPPKRSEPAPRRAAARPEPDRNRYREEEYDDDDRPRRPRRKPKTGSNTGLIIGLVAGGVGLLVLIIVVVVVIVVLNSNTPRQMIVGKWQPTGIERQFGVELYEFTSDGRITIQINFVQPMVVTGTYHFVSSDTMEINMANIGGQNIPNQQMMQRQTVRVNVTNDTLVLTNTQNGQQSMLQRRR